MIPLTTGSGYLNGINIKYPQAVTSGSAGQLVKVEVTIDGGTPQLFTVYREDYDVGLEDGTYWAVTGYIPLYLRFNTSIRVRLERFTNSPYEGTVNSVVSWSLD